MSFELAWKNRICLNALTALQVDIHDAMYGAGWWNEKGTGRDMREDMPTHLTKLLLVHSEISEAVEGYRKNQQDDKLPHRKMIEVELADAIVRILDLAGAMRLDVASALSEKMEYNMVRKDHKPEERAKEGGKAF